LEDAEIQEIIQDRIDFAETEGKALLSSFHMNDFTVEIGAFIKIRDAKTIYDIKPGEKSYNINSFESIGWPDPFPI
jgi:hypothetical protein